MPRKKRTLDRDAGVERDASLLVIASEDTYAVRRYFERFRLRRVQFVVLNTEYGRSSPADVVARLDRFKRENATQENDQFWVCIDQDHWAETNHIQNLTQVLRLCRQKGHHFAISNPCFELWLLLHFQDVPAGAKVTCREISQYLSRIAGGYNKKNCDRLPFAASMVHDAIARAKTLDVDLDELPDHPVTRVYRIVEELQQRDAIDLS